MTAPILDLPRRSSSGPPPPPSLTGVPSSDRHTRDGRTVINRAEMCRTFGVSESAAERWWRGRDRNGHPPVAHQEGRRMWWDEDALRVFVAEHDSEPDEVTVDGRALLSRAALARRLNMREQTLTDLYHRRADNGHPEPVHRQGRRLYWDPEAVESWDAARQGAQRATLTQVDRSGDPEELLDMREAAQVLGYRGPQTITSYRSRNPGYFPDPDEPGELRWRRRTLWEFADRRSRPGRAGHDRSAPR
ncbi:hypothetical protein EV383_6273 [Pseudonocardia sediminis]|uniref:Uncharacterized protein n=1 Tax=Pseudonocardia sediminis TaxID=1397368 RepID=A0A4V6ME04_PSEST|nr:hypothetical protein EV383_6273 [Pseudonocardia sediminis]